MKRSLKATFSPVELSLITFLWRALQRRDFLSWDFRSWRRKTCWAKVFVLHFSEFDVFGIQMLCWREFRWVAQHFYSNIDSVMNSINKLSYFLSLSIILLSPINWISAKIFNKKLRRWWGEVCLIEIGAELKLKLKIATVWFMFVHLFSSFRLNENKLDDEKCFLSFNSWPVACWWEIRDFLARPSLMIYRRPTE